MLQEQQSNKALNKKVLLMRNIKKLFLGLLLPIFCTNYAGHVCHAGDDCLVEKVRNGNLVSYFIHDENEVHRMFTLVQSAEFEEEKQTLLDDLQLEFPAKYEENQVIIRALLNGLENTTEEDFSAVLLGAAAQFETLLVENQ